MRSTPSFCQRARRPLFVAIGFAALASASLLAQPKPALPVSAGDVGMRVGDRIILRVDGETQLTDTFTVTAGPALVLPVVGSIALAGVRREDLEKQVTTEIGRFIRNPVVRVRLLVRVAVLGEIGRPGFYSVPIDFLVNDVLMMAGGPSKEGKVEKIRIERNGEPVWESDSLKVAMAGGLTLAQLDVQPEDAIIVPKGFEPEKFWRIVALFLTIPVAIIGLTRLGGR